MTLQVWLRALRIRHWIKNFFVFIPFLLSTRFGWNPYLLKALLGVFLFCIMSSAVYLLNDILDLKSDRLHPEKRKRPMAAGKISVRAGIAIAGLLAAVALSVELFFNIRFFLVLVAYAANNLIYSYYLKKKTVLDVMSIAFGFVIRVYGGGFIIDIEITKWLVAAVFALSLFMGFGKRRSEYQDLKDEAVRVRKVHESYNVQKLDLLMGTSAAFTIVTYMLYSLAPETKATHGTDNIIFTTPFVVYCIYRFMLKVQEEKHGDNVEVMLKDKGFLIAGSFWLMFLVYIVHYHK
jgi:4-hydroxybenzoate polyprenyltransferase